VTNIESKVKRKFKAWYDGLRPMKQYGGRPAKGTIAAALIVLERLRENCDLQLGSHLAKGGAQIAGLTISSLRKILKRFGETRPFPSEGGRTNRGNNRPIGLLLTALEDSGFGTLSRPDREALLDRLQSDLIRSLDGYYKLERICFEFLPTKPPRNLIGEILARAQQRNQSGPVAQHLVGAKLALRFPHIRIDNFAYSAADDQAGRPGDFHVGNTAFHVTVAPNMAHISRCDQNLKEGLSAYLLVSESKLTAARALVETEHLEGCVVAESVESFVGQNLSELAEFAPEKFSQKLSELLAEYNRRVEEVETDTSLLIEIPLPLRQHKM